MKRENAEGAIQYRKQKNEITNTKLKLTKNKNYKELEHAFKNEMFLRW